MPDAGGLLHSLLIILIMQVGCVYCGDHQTNREHWIPRGLGRFDGYSPLLNRVCTACNRRLGLLDEELLRTGPSCLHLPRLGVRQRDSHRAVNAMEFRSGSAQPPNRLARAVSDGDVVLREPFVDARGRHCSRPLRQVVVCAPSGQRAAVAFPLGYDASLLKQSLVEKGLGNARLTEFFAAPSDLTIEGVLEAQVHLVLSEVFGAFKDVNVWHGETDAGLETHEFVSRVGLNYFRAIAKFGFHYFLWANGHLCHGDEPEFDDVRTSVQGVQWHDGLVCATAEQFFPPFAAGQVPRYWSHFLGASAAGGRLQVWIQMFVGPDSLPAPHLVALGRAPATVPHDWAVAHAAVYMPTEGHDGRLIQLTV